MITLREVLAGEDPFDLYPHLRSIWDDPNKVEFAAECAALDAHMGEVFLIEAENEIVGITGFFKLEDDPPTRVRLRWTGVVPQCRRQGYTSQAVRSLIPLITSKYKDTKSVLESTPVNENGRSFVQPFFASLGFVPVGDPYEEEWVSHLWQDYELFL